MTKIKPSDITPEHLYQARRRFIKGAGVAALGAILAACGVKSPPVEGVSVGGPDASAATGTPIAPSFSSDELGNPLTAYEAVTSYTNFYEFGPRKDQVVPLVEGFKANPWTVRVGGLVHRPRTFDLEERIYRLRCVEAWSMVIPWIGFPLARLLEAVEPLSKARYVRFETLYAPEQMPGQRLL